MINKTITILLLTFSFITFAQTTIVEQGYVKKIINTNAEQLTLKIFPKGADTSMTLFLDNYRKLNEQEKEQAKSIIFQAKKLEKVVSIHFNIADEILELKGTRASKLYNTLILEDFCQSSLKCNVQSLMYTTGNNSITKQYREDVLGKDQYQVSLSPRNAKLSSSYSLVKRSLEKKEEGTTEKISVKEEASITIVTEDKETKEEITREKISARKVFLGYGLRAGLDSFSSSYDENAVYLYLEAGGVLWQGVAPIVGVDVNIGVNPLKAGSKAHGTLSARPLVGVAYSDINTLCAVGVRLNPEANDEGSVDFLENNHIAAIGAFKLKSAKGGLVSDDPDVSLKVELNYSINEQKLSSCSVGFINKF